MWRMAAKPTFPLHDRQLDGQLAAMLRQWRADGLSFRAIADRLASSGVDVTAETARRWVRHLEAEHPGKEHA